uniref:Uncharacterized protein n=1 Tax=Anopheles stephensi TaxID=30069 RepID=A0A182XZ72_ANOST
MDIVVFVVLKIFFMLFLIGGYYLARTIHARRTASVIVTQDIPGQGLSAPVTVTVPDAQQYNNYGFVQLARNPQSPVPPAQNVNSTSAYPAIPAAYPAQHPAPYPAQPYMQHYPLQTSAAPPTAPPHQQPTPVQFPSLPNTGMQYPAPPAASAMPGPPDARMFNPPSYDQVVAESLPVQPPYNPNFKG